MDAIAGVSLMVVLARVYLKVGENSEPYGSLGLAPDQNQNVKRIMTVPMNLGRRTLLYANHLLGQSEWDVQLFTFARGVEFKVSDQLPVGSYPHFAFIPPGDGFVYGFTTSGHCLMSTTYPSTGATGFFYHADTGDGSQWYNPQLTTSIIAPVKAVRELIARVCC